MKTGHTPSRSVPEYWENATIPWFTLADVWQLRDGQQVYLGETANKISELGLANSAAELLPARTVVLSRTASVGFSGVMPQPMATSQDFWNWVCGPELVPEYLNYQFKAIAPQLRAFNMGSTHQTIYQKDAAGIEIIVPPIQDQRAIVQFLDHETEQIDGLIAEQVRLMDLLRERATAVVVAALAPQGGWVASRIKHFAETSLGKMLDAGRAPRPGDVPTSYVRAADVLADGSVNFSHLNEMTFSVEEIERLDLRAGDVLIIEGGATVGRPGFVTSDVPGVSFQKTVNRVRTTAADPRFLYWSMRSLYDSGFYNSYYGSVSFAHLTGEKLREISLWLPSIEQQRTIARRLDELTLKIDVLIKEAESLIQMARERRSALITAVVTGQADVRRAARPPAIRRVSRQDGHDG